MKKITLITIAMMLIFALSLTAQVYDFGKITVDQKDEMVTVTYPITKGPMLHKEDAEKNPQGQFTWSQVEKNLKDTQPVVWVFKGNNFIDAAVTPNGIQFTCPIKKIAGKTWNFVFFADDGNYWTYGEDYGDGNFGFNIISEKSGKLVLKEPKQ